MLHAGCRRESLTCGSQSIVFGSTCLLFCVPLGIAAESRLNPLFFSLVSQQTKFSVQFVNLFVALQC